MTAASSPFPGEHGRLTPCYNYSEGVFPANLHLKERTATHMIKKIAAAMIFACLWSGLSAASAQKAQEELVKTRNGNVFSMTDCRMEEGNIVVVIRCDFSPAEREKNVVLLKKQFRADAPGADPDGLKYNEFCLRYSEDGAKYQRRYDRYCDENDRVIRSLGLDPDYWYDTPVSPTVLPAKALLAAAKRLNAAVNLPQPGESGETSDSLQSAAAAQPLEVRALTELYRTNRAVFEANYENAVIQVRGIAGALRKQFGLPAMILAPQDSNGRGILCCFDEVMPRIRRACNPGDRVIVEGVWRKGAAEDAAFVMDRCSILRADPAPKSAH